jgi:hypothetical protein
LTRLFSCQYLTISSQPGQSGIEYCRLKIED